MSGPFLKALRAKLGVDNLPTHLTRHPILRLHLRAPPNGNRVGLSAAVSFTTLGRFFWSLVYANLMSDPSASTPAPSTRRSKKGSTKQDEDVSMKDVEENQSRRAAADRKGRLDGGGSGDSEGDGNPRDIDDDEEEDDDDPFRGGFLGGPGGPPAGLSSTLRALSGMMSGVSTRLRDILNNLRQKDDPSVQLIALQELSEILLVSTEDNLSGHFSPDQFVKELVTLMQPSQLGEENPEMMLLACRCIANLMEALPASTANVVYGGAVPILCQKLLEIQFIDLAEQALSVSLMNLHEMHTLTWW